jgi:hypothetical protein
VSSPVAGSPVVVPGSSVVDVVPGSHLFPFCLWFDEDVTSVPTPTVYSHDSWYGAKLFPSQWSKSPFSWTSCDDPNPPLECKCIEQCK